MREATACAQQKPAPAHDAKHHSTEEAKPLLVLHFEFLFASSPGAQGPRGWELLLKVELEITPSRKGRGEILGDVPDEAGGFRAQV